MKTIKYPNKEDWPQILQRPTQTVDDIESMVDTVFSDVKELGDNGIKAYTTKFDGIELKSFLVTEDEILVASRAVSFELKQAIQIAKQNIERFHAAQQTDIVFMETMKGVECWQEKRPIEKVGLYIPGGTAPLFSTVLMLAVPAQIAGCKEVILCSPPNTEGKIANEILYAAQLCGVTKVFKVGGIQAIAGMTFGTKTIPQVYKIFGPGNQYVTVAKQIATKYGVAIDMPAGPSELLVLADDTANASFVASDLLSQAEHGVDSQVILVSNSEKLIEEVTDEVEKQLQGLPRKEIAKKAIENSRSILLETKREILNLVNEYGPEHLIICVKDEDFYLDRIRNAGSVFIGNYTPESAGDYASGTNHTLPTNGYTKAYSGVNLDSFLKSITFQRISDQGILKIGKSIELMAEAEGLQGHKNAVTLRLESLNGK